MDRSVSSTSAASGSCAVSMVLGDSDQTMVDALGAVANRKYCARRSHRPTRRESGPRLLRGGSFNNQPANVRSANCTTNKGLHPGGSWQRRVQPEPSEFGSCHISRRVQPGPSRHAVPDEVAACELMIELYAGIP